MALPYQALADAVLVVHFALVLFVVAGLGVIVVGNLRHWSWVNHLWLRGAHLAAIAVVVGQAWFGAACPLTTLEVWLRRQAGTPSYETSFIEHWVQRLLFWEAPAWVFVLAYSGFALLVAAAWWAFPPRPGHRHDDAQ